MGVLIQSAIEIQTSKTHLQIVNMNIAQRSRHLHFSLESEVQIISTFVVFKETHLHIGQTNPHFLLPIPLQNSSTN